MPRECRLDLIVDEYDDHGAGVDVSASGPGVLGRTRTGTGTPKRNRNPHLWQLCWSHFEFTLNPASVRKQFPSAQHEALQFQPQPFHPAEEPAHQPNTGWLSSHKRLPIGTAFRGFDNWRVTRKEGGCQCHHHFILGLVLERTGLKR